MYLEYTGSSYFVGVSTYVDVIAVGVGTGVGTGVGIIVGICISMGVGVD